MLRKLTAIGALVALAVAGLVMAADRRAPVAPPSTIQSAEVAAVRPRTPPAAWRAPLVDRMLSQAEKAGPLADGLTEAIARIEPIYDPTRLDGTGTAAPPHVSAGTASMDNVFADRWRRASLDANVDAQVRAIAMAWQSHGVRPCGAFTKAHAHGWGNLALTGLSAADCANLLRSQVADPATAPIVVAWIGVPVFAAPLPGSRMTSADFWAARRARIAEARAQAKWRAGAGPVAEADR